MIRIEEELVVNNKTIDARILSRMFLAGAKNLEAKKEWINELNVFPVPDGDTGTNMTMTIMAAAAEVGSLGEPDMESLAKAISSGSLRGARGNSVIFPLWGRFMEMRRLSGEVKGTEAFIGREEIPLSLGRMEPSAMNAQRFFAGSV